MIKTFQKAISLILSFSLLCSQTAAASELSLILPPVFSMPTVASSLIQSSPAGLPLHAFESYSEVRHSGANQGAGDKFQEPDLRGIYSFSDVTYLYNKLNFLIRETHKFGTLTFAVNNSFDKAGNRTKVTYPSGKFVNYTYNAINQVTAVSVNSVALANYAYDPLNRLTTKNLLGGTTKAAVHGYDAANQLLTLENKLTPANTLISKHTYTYDLAGNRLTHANQTAATASMTFAYNQIYELTGVTGAQTHSYAYDKVGNRTTADGTAYVSNNLNQYTTVAGAALTYNFNGNLTQEPGASYVYDAENRLLTVTKGTTVANYRYDGFNRRVSKEIGTVKTFYIHDGNEIVEERDAAGALVADYTLGPKTDEVLTMTRGGQTYYYFYDGLGSVRQITDAAGAVIESYDYDVYGQPVAASAVGNPAMFTGRWFDSESGLYYYRARYYSPTLGRFLQWDKVGYVAGMNLYKYVGNNPVRFTDPSGLWGVEVGGVNFGVGNPTFLFGKGSGDYFLDSLAATADGFIPFLDPFKEFYNDCDKNLDWSKLFGGMSRDAFLSALSAGLFNAGNQSVFYSGEGALNAALASKGNGKILGETLGGSLLNKLESLIIKQGGKGLPRTVWDFASAIFSANAKGTVQLFLRNPRSDSTFLRVEERILRRLGNVKDYLIR